MKRLFKAALKWLYRNRYSLYKSAFVLVIFQTVIKLILMVTGFSHDTWLGVFGALIFLIVSTGMLIGYCVIQEALKDANRWAEDELNK